MRSSSGWDGAVCFGAREVEEAVGVAAVGERDAWLDVLVLIGGRFVGFGDSMAM